MDVMLTDQGPFWLPQVGAKKVELNQLNEQQYKNNKRQGEAYCTSRML